MTRIYHVIDSSIISRVYEKSKEVFSMSLDCKSMALNCVCKDLSFFPYFGSELQLFVSRSDRLIRGLPKGYLQFDGKFSTDKSLVYKSWKDLQLFLDPKFDFDSEDLPI